jgi:hypothetical protein
VVLLLLLVHLTPFLPIERHHLRQQPLLLLLLLLSVAAEQHPSRQLLPPPPQRPQHKVSDGRTIACCYAPSMLDYSQLCFS